VSSIPKLPVAEGKQYTNRSKKAGKNSLAQPVKYRRKVKEKSPTPDYPLQSMKDGDITHTHVKTGTTQAKQFSS
jgi:hypothetical protein